MPDDSHDKRKPMASAPMRYGPDGAVDWGNMWDSFCALAQEGGPPHRDEMLHPGEDSDPASPEYRFAVEEIARGIAAVSGLGAEPYETGWLAVRCPSPSVARWLAEAILEEQVEARAEGSLLLVPVGDWFTVKGEIKNVITVVAKTTHYWGEHVPPDTKRSLAAMDGLELLRERARGWLPWRAKAPPRT